MRPRRPSCRGRPPSMAAIWARAALEVPARRSLSRAIQSTLASDWSGGRAGLTGPRGRAGERLLRASANCAGYA